MEKHYCNDCTDSKMLQAVLAELGKVTMEKYQLELEKNAYKAQLDLYYSLLKHILKADEDDEQTH